MKKITRISRVDVKRGASCRTDSTISLFIEKADLSGILAYMDTFESGEEPEGKVKKIELVIYEDGDELETIEGLRAENKILRDAIDDIQQPILDAIESSEAITGDIKEDLSSNGQANINLESLDHLNYQYNQGWISEEYYDKTKKELLEPEENEHLPPNQRDLKLYEKSCECETSAIVNGKCANCGGVE